MGKARLIDMAAAIAQGLRARASGSALAKELSLAFMAKACLPALALTASCVIFYMLGAFYLWLGSGSGPASAGAFAALFDAQTLVSAKLGACDADPSKSNEEAFGLKPARCVRGPAGLSFVAKEGRLKLGSELAGGLSGFRPFSFEAAVPKAATVMFPFGSSSAYMVGVVPGWDYSGFEMNLAFDSGSGWSRCEPRGRPLEALAAMASGRPPSGCQYALAWGAYFERSSGEPKPFWQGAAALAWSGALGTIATLAAAFAAWILAKAIVWTPAAIAGRALLEKAMRAGGIDGVDDLNAKALALRERREIERSAKPAKGAQAAPGKRL